MAVRVQKGEQRFVRVLLRVGPEGIQDGHDIGFHHTRTSFNRAGDTRLPDSEQESFLAEKTPT